ncbi:MAG: NADH-quinone oxidoreductase subunit H [Candidatus Omnitrophica bacterium]|nr:NADH-quinone oxidoreductase subunit H [Candidatus Omnitrophota bacterium]MCM8791163.1 NADH-quinone oxidoreductase subunit H [Candidatus Omnitrophota bacterium]
MKIAEQLFLFLVFPGLLFSATMGLFVGWIDRKLTARLQWRAGPPWYQNFVDFIKLALYKETLVPHGAPKIIFLGMPIVGLAAATLVSTLVLVSNVKPHSGFIGDLIVVVYLLLIPPLSLIIGAFSSGNSFASLGASREMKLMLSYELPFILALAVPIMKSGSAIRLGEIILYQQSNGTLIASFSGAISFFAMLLCVQAKLGFIPFDIPEAETEIIAGPYIEYSGKALAILKLTKSILMFVVPILLVTLYFGGLAFSAAGIVKTILSYLFILILMIVIKNTNPRVRIDQALRFFWTVITLLAVISVIFAYLGY